MRHTKVINYSWKRRRCAKCKKWKGFNSFWKNSAFIGGIGHYCKDCDRPHKAEWQRKHPDKLLASGKKHRETDRHKALVYYCKGVPKCQCPKCDVVIERFLTLDHINNDGAKHRKALSGGKSNKTWVPLCTWARRNGYPPIFQVLCYNCNCGKQLNQGVCPHMEV